MKKMTIGEYAKLRNVTTETLRHYDRIGLFHPLERDPGSRYRYYSIEQDEKLGTIRELQHLGMSTEEIKAYFNNRNLNQSYELLQKVHGQLQERLKILQKLEHTLAERIEHLDQIMQHTDFDTIKIKTFDKRLLLRMSQPVSSEAEYIYASLELEHALNEPTPLIANNRLGFMMDQEETDVEHGIPFILINQEKSADPKYIHSIPAGHYACKFYKGDYRNVLNEANLIKTSIIKQGYAVIGPTLQIVQVDISVTDIVEESIFEIQIPIKKA